MREKLISFTHKNLSRQPRAGMSATWPSGTQAPSVPFSTRSVPDRVR